jgi:hypothetical protein
MKSLPVFLEYWVDRRGIMGESDKGVVQKVLGFLKSFFPREKNPEVYKKGNEPKGKAIAFTRPAVRRKEPYFIQIGFDFGTSFSKCVWRDIITDRAFVHSCSWLKEQDLPFLIPSALVLKDGNLSCVDDSRIHYPEGGVYHLKNALVKIATNDQADPVFGPFRRAQERIGPVDIRELVESCAVYLLAYAFGDIKNGLRKRMPDFGRLAKDYMAINMAVPVADAEQPAVNSIYQNILTEAWGLSDIINQASEIPIEELKGLRRKIREEGNSALADACFIYPEVSANVQGFVRSRVSSGGIYLFSDIGGGSVDQSVFIFRRPPHGPELLTYLTGRVYPLGSSHIERVAAECANQSDCGGLEIWRKRKEGGEDTPELTKARSKIAGELEERTQSTLYSAKTKLIVKDQLAQTRLIFGGGGHCDYPYKSATIEPFSGVFFSKSIEPEVVGLPLPLDLELEDHGNYWMRRLNVAYGLSFERNQLTPFIYPREVTTPSLEEIWQPRKMEGQFITKDDV